MHNQFKTQKFKHLMLAMGPRDLNSAPYSPVHCSSHSMTSFQSSELTELQVVENSQLFAQRAHSACTAHGTPPQRVAAASTPHGAAQTRTSPGLQLHLGRPQRHGQPKHSSSQRRTPRQHPPRLSPRHPPGHTHQPQKVVQGRARAAAIDHAFLHRPVAEAHHQLLPSRSSHAVPVVTTTLHNGNSPLRQPPITHVPLQQAYKEQCEAKH